MNHMTDKHLSEAKRFPVRPEFDSDRACASADKTFHANFDCLMRRIFEAAIEHGAYPQGGHGRDSAASVLSV